MSPPYLVLPKQRESVPRKMLIRFQVYAIMFFVSNIFVSPLDSVAVAPASVPVLRSRPILTICYTAVSIGLHTLFLFVRVTCATASELNQNTSDVIVEFLAEEFLIILLLFSCDGTELFQ